MKLRRTILIVLVATPLLAEVTLRVAATMTGRERGMRFDTELGWRPMPNLVRAGSQWGAREPARTNSRGWRDDEHTLEKRPGVRRAVAVGDSFTWGIGVDFGERYTEQLARHVEKLEVVNLGVNAYGPDQELRALQVEGVLYSPDFVIAQLYFGNDFEDVRFTRLFSWPKPHAVLADGNVSFEPAVATWDVHLRSTTYIGELVFRALESRIERNVRAPALATCDTQPLLLAIYREIDALAKRHGRGALIVIAYPPERSTVDPLPAETALRDALVANGLDVLDTHAPFRAAIEAGRSLHLVDDGHWNAEGHAFVAELIAREITKRGWVE